MKKILITTLILLMLTLTACGASSAAQTEANSNTDPNTGILPAQMQILIGTFKLEGTDNAVTAKQAAELLPMWQVYKDLSASDNAAPQEVDAIIAQLQETMTPAQMQAITELKLTRQDMFTVMQDLGLASARPNASGTPQANRQGNNFPGGGFPGGGPGGDQGGGQPGGGFPGGGNGQNLDPQQIATLQARRTQGGGGFANQIPSALMDALIKLLQGKIGS